MVQKIVAFLGGTRTFFCDWISKFCMIAFLLNIISIIAGHPIIPFISYSQCHACCWPGTVRCQIISSHGIDLVPPEYSRLTTEIVSIQRGHADILSHGMRSADQYCLVVISGAVLHFGNECSCIHYDEISWHITPQRGSLILSLCCCCCEHKSDSLVQDCSISIANALEVLHTCTEPLK